MQIVTEVVSHLDGTPHETTNAIGKVAKKLKETKDKFASFAEAPFIKARVVVYQTPEDFLE